MRLTQAPGYQLHASIGRGQRSRPHGIFQPRVEARCLDQALDADRGIAKGEPEAVTIDEPSSMSPSLSADGRYLVYLSNQLGSRSVRVRDLSSGKTITLVASASAFFNPRISGDGGVVAYSDRNGNIFSIPRAGGAVETVCAGCGTTMAVSPDGKRISYEPAQSEDLTYYDVERKARVTVAQRPEDSVLTDGRFSPDGKWMAFHARTKKTTAQVFVVPLDGVLPVPRSAMDRSDGRQQRGDGAGLESQWRTALFSFRSRRIPLHLGAAPERRRTSSLPAKPSRCATFTARAAL